MTTVTDHKIIRIINQSVRLFFRETMGIIITFCAKHQLSATIATNGNHSNHPISGSITIATDVVVKCGYGYNYGILFVSVAAPSLYLSISRTLLFDPLHILTYSNLYTVVGLTYH